MNGFMRWAGLLFLGLPWFSAGWSGGFQIRNIVENEFIYEYSDRHHSWESLRLLYKPDLTYDFSTQWSLRFQADVSYDAYYTLRDKSTYTSAERDQMETVFLLRDTALKYKTDSFDVTFGKQLLLWGYTTGASPVIDIANAQNRLSPFAQINNNPLSELMLKFDSYHMDHWTHSFFYILDKQVDKVPVFESRFNTVPFPFREAEQEDLWGREPQFGYHGEREFSGNRQLAFTFVQALDNAGVFELEGTNHLVIHHNPSQLAGVSYLQEAWQGQVKADASYTWGRDVNALVGNNLSVFESDLAYARVYYDNMSIPNTTVSVGASHLQALSTRPGSFLPERNQLFYAKINRELIDWNAIVELNLQKAIGNSVSVGSDAETAVLTYTYIGINNFQLNLLARKVFRSGLDEPYETGFVFNAKYFF